MRSSSTMSSRGLEHRAEGHRDHREVAHHGLVDPLVGEHVLARRIVDLQRRVGDHGRDVLVIDRVDLGGLAADADGAEAQRLGRLDDAVDVLAAACRRAEALGAGDGSRAAERSGAVAVSGTGCGLAAAGGCLGRGGSRGRSLAGALRAALAGGAFLPAVPVALGLAGRQPPGGSVPGRSSRRAGAGPPPPAPWAGTAWSPRRRSPPRGPCRGRRPGRGR